MRVDLWNTGWITFSECEGVCQLVPCAIFQAY